MSAEIRSIRWLGDRLRILDQRLLPAEHVERDLTTVDDVVEAIGTLAIRGANVIGTAGAYGVVIGVRAGQEAGEVGERLIAARPTAVNLEVAVRRAVAAELAAAPRRRPGAGDHLPGAGALQAAHELLARDRAECALIGRHGRDELGPRDTILTHCNTGKLATTGVGTALGVIHTKHAAGDAVKVFATETRPLGQGGRLTAWELHESGVDVTLLVDSAATALLYTGQVEAVIVGADRIAANGDTANKIGTHTLALAAHAAGVPFYVAATRNAIDPGTESGGGIPIEFRADSEVFPLEARSLEGQVPTWNPAFDVTPAGLITAIITEVGVLRPGYRESIAAALTMAPPPVEPVETAARGVGA